MSLSYIAQQITIYSGFFLGITGIVGNGINVLVFSSVRSYRKTPCIFYFLSASVYNIVQVLTVLTSRIATSGYGIDLTRTSISWCKIRPFIATIIALISLSCTCLATIDQFFATSQRVNVRRLSNIKLAHRIVFIVSILWVLYAIPNLIFYDISSIMVICVNTNYAYSIYYPVYLSLLCFIPSLVMTVFGYLTYRNIHQTRVLAQQQADRQLIRMVFIEILLVIISYAPLGIIAVYNLITASSSKDTNRLNNEGFAIMIFNVTTYIYNAGNCYMFLISSSRFRRETKSRIFLCLRLNHVTPTQMPTDAAAVLQNRTEIRPKK